MFEGFQTQKSKMSQGEEEEEGRNEVHLGLPCGSQKLPWFLIPLRLDPSGLCAETEKKKRESR